MTASHAPDVIDKLAGLAPGHPLQAVRAQRAQARDQSQESYRALFEPASTPAGDFTLAERFAVATFVAALHGPGPAVDFYAGGLAGHSAAQALVDALVGEAALGAASGPYGHFPAGPLSAEDAPGPVYRVGDAARAVLGDRLAAALVHAHLLLFHPRDASAPDLAALLDAGWSPPDIVTLSQLVAFLGYQIRAAAGLQALASSPRAIQS
ncbi:CMD domain protein [Variovorax sp. LjRoot178]|uniref:CMD domain protein n=1 Tax=Variovorax sp. LjRoot178 TaxID=3342277 RepID=UPI003ECFB96C